jgi:LysM repeat protein
MVVVIAAAVLIVRGQLASKHASRTPPVSHVGRRGHRPAATASTFYVVKAGDSLSVISAHTGVPVPTLESLNPNIDPNTLQTGQRLRLRQ